jgi:AraC-like DNA-binding protein
MQNLLQFPEWNCLYHLVQHAGKGLSYSKIAPRAHHQLTAQIQGVVESHSLSGLIDLLSLLVTIEGNTISNEIFPSTNPLKSITRLNVALHFMHLHYVKPLTLKEVAASIHLSESAFSKFFIRSMGKPFATYLNELRIAHASRLLIETDKPISYIAHASGFENLSHFNRTFLKMKKVTPKGFRNLIIPPPRSAPNPPKNDRAIPC